MDYKIDYIERHDDERGNLVVFMKNGELKKKYKEFGQIYFVTFKKDNVVRGNHYHKHWREWFGIVTGKVKVVLKDVKTDEVVKLVLNSKANEYARLEIGPYVAHAFKNISKKASLLNYTDTEWSSKDTFPEKLL